MRWLPVSSAPCSRHVVMDASGYDQAPFIPELYDYVIPYATRPDVGLYVEAARTRYRPHPHPYRSGGNRYQRPRRFGRHAGGLPSENRRRTAGCSAAYDAPPRRHSGVRARPPLSTHHRASPPFQYLLTVEEQLSCLNCVW